MPRWVAGKQLVVAAKSRAALQMDGELVAPCLLQCRGGNWKLMYMPWFVPWCVNERTTEFVFAVERSATNDPVQSLTKSSIFRNSFRNSGTYWKFVGAFSMLARPAKLCVILTPLVKYTRNLLEMTHNLASQRRLFDASELRQNDEFPNFMNFTNFKFSKESNTVPLHLLKSLCIPIQLMKGVSIPLLTLEIMTTTTSTVQHDAAEACCKLHNSRIQRLPLTGQKPTKIIIFD